MSNWIRVKWTEAGQVLRLLGWPEADGPAATLPPDAFFRQMRETDRDDDAAEFLALALPRWEAVAWAARAVRDLTGDDDLDPGSAEALKAALLWVQDPTEPRRRAAQAAAETSAETGAARLAALAAFYSGGSIAPLDCEPLPAPRDAAGRCAAGAVLVAAACAREPATALARCLDAGVALAASRGED